MMRTLLLAALVLSVDASSSSCKSLDTCHSDDLSLLQVSANPDTLALVETDMRDSSIKRATVASTDEPPTSVHGAAPAPAAEKTPTVADSSSDKSAPANAEGSTVLSNSTENEKGEKSDKNSNATNATSATNISDSNGDDAVEVGEKTAPAGCAVKEDSRAKAWFAETSSEGTPCVFGVDGDVRDEGFHCIFDNGDFGSNGWCYTAKDRSSWGSCNDLCPLYGHHKQLGKKLDHMNQMVDKVLHKLNVTHTDEVDAANSTEKMIENTKEEAPATDAAQEPKAPNGSTPPTDAEQEVPHASTDEQSE